MRLNPAASKLLGALTISLCSLTGHAQTPFIPQPEIPATGVPFLKGDLAYPKYVGIYDQIQSSFGSAENLENARKAIGELQKSYPLSPYPYFALAEYKYALAGQDPNGNSEASAILDRVMRTNGANLPDGYILKAKIAADQGDTYGSLANANIAVRFAPEKPEAQFALARAQDINEHYQQAEDAYRKFIALEPNPKRKSNGYAWLGMMFSNLPRNMQAANRLKTAEAYRMSSELGGTYSHTLRYASFLLTTLGDVDTSSAYFNRMLKADASDGEAQYFLGVAEYLKWAKANPTGTHAELLDAIENRTGVSKQDIFATSPGYDGLEVIAAAMLRANAIKNINAVCSDSCMEISNGIRVTAMISAAYADKPQLLKQLSEHGGNINAQGFENRTPLMYALFNKDIELASYLLKKGARVNVAAQDGLTPMFIAVTAKSQSAQMVSLLLKYKADPMGVTGNGQSMPAAAMARGNLDALKVLVNEGKIDVNSIDNHGFPLLYFALSDPASVRLLLSKGANPWAKTSQGDMLIWAQAFPPESITLVEDARKKNPQK